METGTSYGLWRLGDSTFAQCMVDGFLKCDLNVYFNI